MDSTPDVNGELVVKALAELADADYQTQVWAGRVPAVGSSLIACYASLFGESGLARALDAGPVFSPAIDRELFELRVVLEAVDDCQPIGLLMRDPALTRARLLSAELLAQLGVTNVVKRGLPELDLPREIPRWSRGAQIALTAVLGVAILVVLVSVLRPSPNCSPVDSSDIVSAYQCH